MPPDPTEDSVLAGLASLQSGYAGVAEIINSYRAMLLQHGYSPEAAEQMTVDYHRLALPIIFAASAAALEASRKQEGS